jgi:hypothetical protein
MEQGLHVDADLFVVAVDLGPDGGFASHPGATDSGEDGADDLLAQGEQGGDDAGWLCGQVVAPGVAGFDDEVFAAQFA